MRHILENEKGWRFTRMLIGLKTKEKQELSVSTVPFISYRGVQLYSWCKMHCWLVFFRFQAYWHSIAVSYSSIYFSISCLKGILDILRMFYLFHYNKRKTWKGIMIRNVLKRRRECGTYLATARRPLQLMKAAVPAESYVIHLSSASLVSCDVYGQ